MGSKAFYQEDRLIWRPVMATISNLLASHNESVAYSIPSVNEYVLKPSNAFWGPFSKRSTYPTWMLMTGHPCESWLTEVREVIAHVFVKAFHKWGGPKSSISGIPIITHPFWGILRYPIYGNHKIIIIASIPRVWCDEQIQFTHCLTNAACQKNAVAHSPTTLCLRNSIEIPIFDPVTRATRLVFQPGIPHLHLEVVTRASLPWLLLFAAGFSAVKPPEKHKVRGSCLV